ncbi:recombinase family protein [Actinocrinis puniceicyclus]|uniref:Recombinase family protein n=1 Tax=Actinocrinis puniceicyclus TaxID=977794 RepID=A0A8J7WP50_9ACTN|nr:recombinase family protein [Actinocrinis puniceicyclus]MBS2964295.1 recombinase family protein [Actinocrinis puniceicyclus]
MSIDPVRQTMTGDLTGLNFAILDRLSNESKRRRHLKDQEAAGVDPKARPRTGMDINNRDEQVTDCRQYVESRGGRIVHIYDEEHTSAYKRRKIRQSDGSVIYRVIRPVYAAMLRDLAKGKAPNGERLDGAICPDLDRLTRDNRDLEDSIDTVVHHHRPIIDLSGALDLNTQNGQTNARVITAFKNAQSADTGRRVGRKHKALQREGIPTGGHRPFGWQDDKRTLHPVEAPLLRTAVAEILNGRAVTAVAADWNRRGIPTARGKLWRAVNLKAVLRNPRMAGYRMVTIANADEDNGETLSRHVITLKDEDGNPVMGQWERMISPADWDKLIAIIGETPQRGDGNNTRSHLATGTLRCGKGDCDTPLRATKAPPSAHKPEGFFWYTCLSKGQGGCGGVKVNGWETDEALMWLAIEMYQEQAAEREASAEPEPWQREGELTMVREDMAAAKAARKAGKITAERYYADLAEQEAAERALLKEKNATIKAAQVAADVPVTLEEDWTGGNLSLTEQRVYLERAFSAVIVAPTNGRRGVPTHHRLTPVPAQRG